MKSNSKFFKEHNISRSHFAKLIGISHTTLSRFEKGFFVNPDTKKKIMTGFDIMNELNLVYPDIRYINNEKYEKIYNKNKKKSNSYDKKFATAFKKAMK